MEHSPPPQLALLDILLFNLDRGENNFNLLFLSDERNVSADPKLPPSNLFAMHGLFGRLVGIDNERTLPLKLPTTEVPDEAVEVAEACGIALEPRGGYFARRRGGRRGAGRELAATQVSALEDIFGGDSASDSRTETDEAGGGDSAHRARRGRLGRCC